MHQPGGHLLPLPGRTGRDPGADGHHKPGVGNSIYKVRTYQRLNIGVLLQSNVKILGCHVANTRMGMLVTCQLLLAILVTVDEEKVVKFPKTIYDMCLLV